MPSIDERIVSISFENAKFEANVAKTMATLVKLNESLRLTGASTGLQALQAAADQINFTNAAKSADGLKTKLDFSGAVKGLSDVGTAAKKVSLDEAGKSADGLKGKFESAFSAISSAAGRVNFSGITSAIERVKSLFSFGREADASFSQIESSAGHVHLTGITNAINEVSQGFSVLQGVAAVALGNIATKAATAGANMVKSLTLGPLTQGFQEYSTNLNSIQTILANTQSKGSDLQDVNAALQELNKYSDKTIYNFGEMAKNIGTFTAAGVDLKTSTEGIKGIANLAALSGSSSDQASQAMYQLSQAISAGKVNMQDWISVRNAGMGGEVFQNALFTTAKAMGTIKNVRMDETFKEWQKAGNSFTKSLTETQKEAGGLKTVQKDAARTVSDAQAAAADSIEASAKRVQAAQKGVADAAKQAATDTAAAVRAQSDTVKQSAEDVRAALDGVRDARKRLAEAMKPPSKDELQAATDNLKTTQLDQADLATAVTEAQKEQTRAAQDLTAAQQKLASLPVDASPADRQAAQRAVEDAQKRVTDAADAQTRALLQQRGATRDVDQATKDLQTTREKGTKKDQNVKDAQDSLTQATTKYKDAQVKAQDDIKKAAQNVADVQIKAADSQKQAGQALADAQKDQSKTIVDAQRRVADAHTAAAKQINAAKESLSPKGPDTWLTSDVLTNTLKQFTGDMTTAQLKAQGLTDEQIKSIKITAKTAQDAAEKVKTIGQVFSVAKETIGSGWSTTFQTIFGNFGEAKSTFTDLSNTINGFINTNSNARNAVLKDWAALGGRKVLIEGIKDAFIALMSVIKPIKDAFREIFPAKTGKDLFDLTVKFRDFMENLKIGPETADKLKRTFAGFFALLDIGKHIVGEVFTVIGKLLGVASGGSGGFLTFTATVGDFLVKLDQAIKSGKGFSAFFENLPTLLSAPLHLLGQIKDAIGKLFGADTGDTSKATDGIGKLKDSLGPLKTVLDFIIAAWGTFKTLLGGLVTFLTPIVKGIGTVFGGIGTVISNAFKNVSYTDILATVQTGLVAGLVLMFKKLFSGGLKVDIGGGLFGQLKGTLDGLTGSLKAMQAQLKAKTLLEIAGAIGILAVGVIALSQIDPKKLANAMTAIAVGLGELVGAMALLSKVGGSGAFLTLPFIAAAMIGLAFAIDILSVAVIAMSKLSWEDLTKGLAGVAGVLVAVGLGVKAIPPSIILVGPALIPLAAAIVILAGAVKIFATMDWKQMGKGLAGVAGSLVAVGLGVEAIPANIILVGPGLLVLAIALTALSVAVGAFGRMKTDTLVTGLLGIGAALVIIGLAMSAMPPTLPLTAAGLILVSIALTGLAAAVGLMGGMKTSTIVKGLIGIGGALVVLALGLTAMAGTLPGSAGLLLAATGLAILVPVLGALGIMKWSTIGKGLAAIAATLLIIGVAGSIAAPGLMAIGLGLAVLGVGMLAVGSGVYLMSKGLALLSDTGMKGLAVMVTAITAFVALIPAMIIQFIKGLVDVVAQIAKIAPLIVDSLAKIITTIINLVVKMAPAFGIAIGSLLDVFLTTIAAKAEPIIAAGWDLLMKFLSGIATNVSSIVGTVADIIVSFLTALSNEIPRIVAAGAALLVSFIGGIISSLPKVITTVATLITTFLTGLTQNMPRVVAAAANLIVSFLQGVANNISKVIAAGANIIISVIEGLESAKLKFLKKAVELIGNFLEAAAKAMIDLANKIATVIVNFLNGMAKAIRDHSPEINAAGFNVASALIEGLIDGLTQLADKVTGPLGHIVRGMIKKVLDLLGIHSPSTVFYEIGTNTMQGLTDGLDAGGAGAIESVRKTGKKMTMAFKSDLPIGDWIDPHPVITPVLDIRNAEKRADDLHKALMFEAIQAEETSRIAARAAAGQAALDAAAAPHMLESTHDRAVAQEVHFEQNNYSPEYLSAIDIYRQTHNQLAMAKSVLGVQGPIRGGG